MLPKIVRTFDLTTKSGDLYRVAVRDDNSAAVDMPCYRMSASSLPKVLNTLRALVL